MSSTEPISSIALPPRPTGAKPSVIYGKEIIDSTIQVFETCEIDLRDPATAQESGSINKRDRGIWLLVDNVRVIDTYVLTITMSPSGHTTTQRTDWSKTVLKLIPKDASSNDGKEIVADHFLDGFLGQTGIQNVPPGLYGFRLEYKN